MAQSSSNVLKNEEIKMQSEEVRSMSSNILHIGHLDNSVTDQIIRRTVRGRGLRPPRDVRVVKRGAQSSAFLEFRSEEDAEAVIEEFNSRLFSVEENISFLNLSTRKARPRLRSSVSYVFLCANFDTSFEISSTTSTQPGSATVDKHFSRLQDLVKYLETLKSKNDLVAVVESVIVLHKFKQICDKFNQLFSGWLDLNEIVLSRYEKCYLKHVSNDKSLLSSLYDECFATSSRESIPHPPHSKMMKQILETVPDLQVKVHPTTLNSKLTYVVAALDVGLVKVTCDGVDRHVLASLAVKTEQQQFNCGIDLSVCPEEAIDWDTAKMLGLHLSPTGSWLKDSQPCLSEKAALDHLLAFLSNNLEKSSVQSREPESHSNNCSGGIILTTILQDDSLVYLVAALKVHGLLKQFDSLVAGFSHLETVFKKKKICRKVFSLKYLDRYLNNLNLSLKYGNLETEKSEVLALVEFTTFKNILGENICTEIFLRDYCYAIRSGEFNKLIEENLHKVELSIFNSEVYECRIHHVVTLLPGTTTEIPVVTLPALSSVTNSLLEFIPECFPDQKFYQVFIKKYRTNPSGMFLVKVLNLTKNKIRLPKGLFFGLLRQLQTTSCSSPPSPEISILGVVNNNPVVDLQRIKLEPMSPDSSSENVGDPSLVDANLQQASTFHQGPGAGGSLDEDLEFMASSATAFLEQVDILRDLPGDLSTEHPGSELIAGWEELNPTFSSLGITTSLTDVDMGLVVDPTLPNMFDDIAGVVEEDGEHQNKEEDCGLGVKDDLPDKRKEEDKGQKLNGKEDESSVDNTSGEPPRIYHRVAKSGVPVPLSRDKPLVAQIKVIKEKIKRNEVDGDLSDQFPSLIGEEEYFPLYKTLMQYTAVDLKDVPYEIVEFGEKVYGEIISFDLKEGLNDLVSAIVKVHEEIGESADLDKWLQAVITTFSSLAGINDINGDNFDLMLVQWLVLHCCDQMTTSGDPGPDSGENNIRDMISFPCFDGFDFVEEIPTPAANLPQNPETDVETQLESHNLPCEDIILSPRSEKLAFSPGNMLFVEDGCLPEQILEGPSSNADDEPSEDHATQNGQVETEKLPEPDDRTPLHHMTPELPTDDELLIRTDEPIPPFEPCTRYVAQIPEIGAPQPDQSESPNKEEKIRKISEGFEQIALSLENDGNSTEVTKKNENDIDEGMMIGDDNELNIDKPSHSQSAEKYKILENENENVKSANVEKCKEGIVSNEEAGLTSSNSKLNIDSQKALVSNTEKTLAFEENVLSERTKDPSLTKAKSSKSELIQPKMEENRLKLKSKSKSENVLSQSKSAEKKEEKIPDETISKVSKADAKQKKESKNKVREKAMEKKIGECPAPLDPDEQFSDLYLAIKMEATTQHCSVLVFNGDMPTNAMISGDNLMIRGARQSRDTDVQKILQSKAGEENDVILVLIKNLAEERVLARLAIPLSSWEDNKFFFRGFILFRETKDKYWAAFLRDNALHTTLVSSNRIKTFEDDSDSPIEGGIELKLMLKPRSDGVEAGEPKYRASLCIPDPEKKFYDMVETTHWADKTRTHFMHPETVQDIVESCEAGTNIQFLKEGSKRTFFLIRGKDRRACIDGFNKIIQARNMFEQLPGNRPKLKDALEVMMDSIPYSDLRPKPTNTVELHFASHYTGITLRFLEDELAIEGSDLNMLKLSKRIISYNMCKQQKPQVQIGSIMSTSNLDQTESCSQNDRKTTPTHKSISSSSSRLVSSTGTSSSSLSTSSVSLSSSRSDAVRPDTSCPRPGSRLTDNKMEDDEVTSTTREDTVLPDQDDEIEPVSMAKEGPEPFKSDTNLVASDEKSDSVITESKAITAHEKNIVTLDDEDEALRRIFYSEGPSTTGSTFSSHESPSSSDPSFIQPKLGKTIRLAPGEERCITLGLKQKLTKKYRLRSHPQFVKYQDKIEVVFELVNGTNVQIDLKNISGGTVTLEPDQHIVLLEERIPGKSVDAKRRKHGPGLVRKHQVSEGGIKNPKIINKSLKMAAAGAKFSQKTNPELKTGSNHLAVRRYNVSLLENVSILGKSVSYARVQVVGGDELVFNKVHEIRRHPDFKNNDIFVPERQKKKICKDINLHMSIRNRQDNATSLPKGTIVGQIEVVCPDQSVSTTAKRPAANAVESNSQVTPKSKKMKISANDKQVDLSSTSKAQNIMITSVSEKLAEQEKIGTKADKKKILDLIKKAVAESPSPIVNKMSEKQGEDVVCNHDELKKQACKTAMLGQDCGNVQCQENQQHKFPQDFIMVRNKEYCMDYLKKKVCAKSFAPFVCESEKHVYDVMDICRFYTSYINQVVDNCNSCQKKNIKKVDVLKMEENKDVPSVNEIQANDLLSKKSKKKTKTGSKNSSRTSSPDESKAMTDVKHVENLPTKPDPNKTAPQDKEDEPSVKKSGLAQFKEVTLKQTDNKVEKDQGKSKDMSEIITIQDVETSDNKVASEVGVEESEANPENDEIEIIDQPDMHSLPLNLKCPHVVLNSSLCPQLSGCQNRCCPHAHSISPQLRLSYCARFLEFGACDLSTCTETHLKPQELQDVYTQSLRRAVLSCGRCFFRCKLFNPNRKKHRQDRICYKDFTNYCRKKQQCVFIHLSELEHLNMEPPCKIFAVRGMCPNVSTEKGLAHMTHRDYQNDFFKRLKKIDSKCETCFQELLTIQSKIDTEIIQRSESTCQSIPDTSVCDELKSSDQKQSSVGKQGSSPPAVSSAEPSSRCGSDESLADDFSCLPDLETIPTPSTKLKSSDTYPANLSDSNSGLSQVINKPNTVPAKSTLQQVRPPSYLPSYSRHQGASDKDVSANTSSLQRIRPTPPPLVTDVPSHTSLPPVLASMPTSRIQIKSKSLKKVESQSVDAKSPDKPEDIGNEPIGAKVKDNTGTKVIKESKEDECGAGVCKLDNQKTVNNTIPATSSQPDTKSVEETTESPEAKSQDSKDQMAVTAEKSKSETLDAGIEKGDKIQDANDKDNLSGLDNKDLLSKKVETKNPLNDQAKRTDSHEKIDNNLKDKCIPSTMQSTRKTSNEALSKDETGAPKDDTEEKINSQNQPGSQTCSSSTFTRKTLLPTPPTLTGAPQQNVPPALMSKVVTLPNVSAGASSAGASNTKNEPGPKRPPGSSNVKIEVGSKRPNTSSGCKQEPPAKTRRVCPFFGTLAKCKNGRTCPNIHDLSLVQCRFWKAGSCHFGNRCIRKHSF